MKYEIIKDKEDLLVLVINGVVVTISRDLDVIVQEIRDDYKNRKTSPRRTYDPAVIDGEVPIKKKESTKRSNNLSIGQILGGMLD